MPKILRLGLPLSTETLLGASVKVGKRVKLMRWVQVGASTGIGDQVTLAEGVVIGDNCVISDGVTIGKGALERAKGIKRETANC